VRQVGRRLAARRERQEVGAQAGPAVVDERQRAAVRAPARVVATGEPVAGVHVAAQQLVEREVELRARVEQRLERQAAAAALGLRDGAG
jgi:hypothetical protein